MPVLGSMYSPRSAGVNAQSYIFFPTQASKNPGPQQNRGLPQALISCVHKVDQLTCTSNSSSVGDVWEEGLLRTFENWIKWQTEFLSLIVCYWIPRDCYFFVELWTLYFWFITFGLVDYLPLKDIFLLQWFSLCRQYTDLYWTSLCLHCHSDYCFDCLRSAWWFRFMLCGFMAECMEHWLIYPCGGLTLKILNIKIVWLNSGWHTKTLSIDWNTRL